MANLTTAISVQIDKEDKEKACKIIQKLGVSMSGLINMTIKQLILRGKIPFEIGIPDNQYELNKYFSDEELNNTSNELCYIAEHPDEYKSYDNINDLKKDLLDND